MENENGMIRRPRRRFSAEEKTRIIGLYEASGLTGVEFCRREGVSLYNLQRWLGKRRRAGKARFVELETRPLRSRADTGWDLERERGWKWKGASMSGRFACWPALSGKRLDAEPGRRGAQGVSGSWGD